MSSEAQLHANQANVQLSTGPKTPEGKTKSSLNAVKTGLTGHTVLLPSDDAIAYQKHIQRFFEGYQPATDAEETLVQSVADTEWRLLRIPSLEMGICAVGRIELAAKFDQEDTAVRAALIEAQVFLTYQRQLNNLSIQEGRLRKQREKDLAELFKCQRERKELAEKRMKQASDLYQDAQRAGQPFDPAEFGFEFSIEQIEHYLDDVMKRIAIRQHTYFSQKEAA
ncbi:MAG: hypothetical protein ACR2JB_18490 [Bryobacteraceae bacterium]